MTKPLVSIMMPTYRRPKLLRQALASAIGQTYENLQIIVRDNASGDETPEVVREMGDPRVEFYRSAQTVSPSENGEQCLRLARGKYCMTLADDDSIDLNFVEVLTEALEKGEDVAVAYPEGAFMDEAGRVTERKTPAGSCTMDTISFLMAWCRVELPLVTPASMFLRTEWLRGIASEFGEEHFHEGHHSDTALMIWLALRGKVFFTDKTCYRYRIHQGNTRMRLTNAEHLAGDKALINFISVQKAGVASSRLTNAEWKTFEQGARSLLADTYYWQAMRRDSEKQNLNTGLLDLAIRPVKVYGPALAKQMLFANRGRIKSWLKGKLHSRV